MYHFDTDERQGQVSNIILRLKRKGENLQGFLVNLKQGNKVFYDKSSIFAL